MTRVKWFSFLSLLLAFVSCDLLRDSPYEVEAWTPGDGFHDGEGKIIVSLLLSHESDRIKTEQAFSLTEDRKPVKGNFAWEGNRFLFLPAAPIESGHNYLISLGTGAQDKRGISLEKKFEASFSTCLPGAKPRVIGVEPEYGGSVSESRGIFKLWFSEQVLINSCLDSISFTPAISGSWRLSDENKTACFIPHDPWQTGILYHARVDSGFLSASGQMVGTEYVTFFSFGTDHEKPVLLKALAVAPEMGTEGFRGGDFCKEEIALGKPGASLPVYSAWESFTKLELVFSKPMDTSLIKNYLITEPSQQLLVCSPPGVHERIVFCFSEDPAWGSTFLFRLLPGAKDHVGMETLEEYCFKISSIGEYSKPPALAGIRIPLSSEASGDLSFSVNDSFQELPLNKEYFDYNVKTPWWIELYFDIARDTSIDLFSVMELFSLKTTNNALIFSPQIVTGDFTREDPSIGWEHFQRIEIRGLLTNTVQSGVVTFQISSGLKDKRGNRNSENFRISLLK